MIQESQEEDGLMLEDVMGWEDEPLQITTATIIPAFAWIYRAKPRHTFQDSRFSDRDLNPVLTLYVQVVS
jgi:hypothetical protein